MLCLHPPSLSKLDLPLRLKRSRSTPAQSSHGLAVADADGPSHFPANSAGVGSRLKQ